MSVRHLGERGDMGHRRHPHLNRRAALTCNGNLASGPRPVLPMHGTALEPHPNFSWNYELGLTANNRT